MEKTVVLSCGGGAAGTEIKVTCAKNLELSKVVSDKPGMYSVVCMLCLLPGILYAWFI